MGKRTLPGWWMKNRTVNGSGRSIPFILICIFGGASTEIAAQEPLVSGSRVRVTAPDCGLRGEQTGVRTLRADTLILYTTECPLASVTRLEVENRSRERTLIFGMVAGGVVGGVLGAMVGQGRTKTVNTGGLFCGTGPFRTGRPCAPREQSSAGLFALGGALAGGALGYLIAYAATDRWTTVDLTPSVTRTSIGSASVGLTARWIF